MAQVRPIKREPACMRAQEGRCRVTCKCSFLEIYNESITDLLCSSQAGLSIREDAAAGVYVEGLTEESVSSGASSACCAHKCQVVLLQTTPVMHAAGPLKERRGISPCMSEASKEAFGAPAHPACSSLHGSCGPPRSAGGPPLECAQEPIYVH